MADRVRASGSPRGTQAVDHALRILDQFESSTSELTLTGLSDRLGLSKSGVHALLVSLVRSKLVERDPTRNTYRLGAHLIDLAGRRLEQTIWRTNCRSVLERLVDVTGETALLGVVEGDRAQYASRLESPHLLRVVGQVGEPIPFHATALGKVLLAQLPQARIEALLARPLRAFSPRTIVDPARLALELESIRRQGFAVSLGERDASTAGVAAPVPGRPGTMPMAVAVVGMLGRLDISASVVAVLEAARSLSAPPGGQEVRANDGPATHSRGSLATP